MDLSKLDQNERLAVFGAIAVFLAGLISSWGGLLLLAIVAAIGMAVVVFLPQLSPSTSLPGSKGSLMAVLGFAAAGSTLITLLQWMGFLGAFGFNSIMFIVALVGSLVMAWAGWQELQAEGGKWRFGTSRTDAPARHEESHGAPAHDAADEPAAEERRTEA